MRCGHCVGDIVCGTKGDVATTLSDSGDGDETVKVLLMIVNNGVNDNSEQ